MDLAKPGDIHEFCRPNAILTFAEYLEDYGDAATKEKGYRLIEKFLKDITDPKLKEGTLKKLADVKSGKRDLFF